MTTPLTVKQMFQGDALSPEVKLRFAKLREKLLNENLPQPVKGSEDAKIIGIKPSS